MRNTDRTQLTPPFLFLIFLCATVPFLPALQAGFVNWDDTYLITENPAIRSLGWSEAWDWLTSTYVNHYHPLLMLTFSVEHSIDGFNPFLFHLTNVLLHGVNAVLVLMLLQHFVRDRLVLALAVVLFALHPLRTEAVVWVSARKDVLSTFFILVSVLTYIRHQEEHRRLYLALSFLAAIAASLSKAIAVVIPILLLAYLAFGRGKITRTSVQTLVSYGVLAFVTGIVAILAQYSTGRAPYDPSFSLLRGLTLPFWNVVFYAWKTMVPAGLSAVYPYPENGGPELLTRSLLSLIGVAVVVIAIIFARPEKKMTFALLWILITLFPVLQWTPVGRAFAADRFTYLPAIGLSLAAALLLDRAVSMRKGTYRPLVRRAGILLLAGLGTVTYIRSEVWKNSETLWRDVLASYPQYAEGYVYLGSALAVESGDTRGAIEAFTRSIALDDRDPAAYSNRALASYRSASPDTAQIISDLTSAIARSQEPLELEVFLAEAYNHFGMTERSYQMCSALLDVYPTLHRVRLLRVRCAFELGRNAVVESDIDYLQRAGIEVRIEGR